MSASVTTTRFNAALAAMLAVPGKHGPDVLAKAAIKVAIGSPAGPGLVQLTPRATAQQIRKDLTTGKIPKLAYLLARKWALKDGVKGKALKAEIAKRKKIIIEARIRSRASSVAGWLVAARKLAAMTPGATLKQPSKTAVPVEDGRAASRSFAHGATPAALTVMLSNAIPAAAKISKQHIPQAMRNATQDHLTYLKKKFGAAIHDAVMGGSSASQIQN